LRRIRGVRPMDSRTDLWMDILPPFAPRSILHAWRADGSLKFLRRIRPTAPSKIAEWRRFLWPDSQRAHDHAAHAKASDDQGAASRRCLGRRVARPTRLLRRSGRTWPPRSTTWPKSRRPATGATANKSAPWAATCGAAQRVTAPASRRQRRQPSADLTPAGGKPNLATSRASNGHYERFRSVYLTSRNAPVL
jgi:hypothetical protein